MKGVLRSAKNFAKGYSDIQIKVRDATSNESAGPSMSQMDLIAQATSQAYLFTDIVYILDKRLNDSGKNWRHVYKTLVVLEYCVCCGSETIVEWALERLHAIKTLREFISFDENGIDNGACVREKSKDIISLLTDPQRLEDARRTRSLPVRDERTVSFKIDTPPSQLINRKQPEMTTQPHGNMSVLRNRSSFEDLQDCDEETAMKLAMAASAENFSQSDSLMIDESHETITTFKQSHSTTTTLLDLDDESFSKLLDTTLPKKSLSDTIMQAGINDRSGSYDGVDNNQFFSVEQYQPAPYKVFSNENHGSINCEKAALLNSDSLKLDPFSDRPILEVDTKNNDKNDDPFADIMAPVIPSHSIALPSNILNDQSVGAKPVLPGNMAPHFSNVNTMSNCINHNVESDIQSMKPSTMSNKSEQHTDPFSDY